MHAPQVDRPSAPAARRQATPRSTLAVCLASLFVLGLLNGVLGPLLPQLSVRTGAPVEALGAVFTALFLGALTMQVAGGWLNERIGLRRMAAAGPALVAAGMVGITFSPSLPAVLACAYLAGAGQGTIDVSTNVLVPAVFEERSAVSAVNLLHFAFGAGAVVSPIVTSAAVEAWGTPQPFLWGSAALGALVSLATARWSMDPKVARGHDARPGARTEIYRSPLLWLLSLALFLGVGVEIGTGGWTVVYANRTSSLGPEAAAMLASGYWLALTVGRLLGVALGMRLTSRRLALLAVGTTCLGSAMVVLGSGATGWTVAGTLLIGLGVGPIFPTLVVIATEIFAAAPSRAVSVIISVSSVGGMLLPPLQGLLLQRVSPLSSVVLVAASCFLMMLLLVLAERLARPDPVRPTAG